MLSCALVEGGAAGSRGSEQQSRELETDRFSKQSGAAQARTGGASPRQLRTNGPQVKPGG